MKLNVLHAFKMFESCPDGWCRIVDGKEGEQFRIVRENYYLVVLEAKPGAMFTGDFQHAGVRNFSVGSPEDKLMIKFFDRIESIVEEANEENGDVPDVTMEMVSMMYNFPNLHKICRFHCSTEPRKGPLRIPRNTVGFVDCRPNPATDEFSDGNLDETEEQEKITSGFVPKKYFAEPSPKIQSAISAAIPATLATPCPLCNAMVQCQNQETLDETLSLHMAACQNSRIRFKRAANHQEHYDG